MKTTDTNRELKIGQEYFCLERVLDSGGDKGGFGGLLACLIVAPVVFYGQPMGEKYYKVFEKVQNALQALKNLEAEEGDF